MVWMKVKDAIKLVEQMVGGSYARAGVTGITII
jgi:hypothetical protein